MSVTLRPTLLQHIIAVIVKNRSEHDLARGLMIVVYCGWLCLQQ